jgi:hypothetical protein
MRGPKPKALVLTAEQLHVVHKNLRTGKTEHRVARRARILLLSHRGLYPCEVAERVCCDPATVWRVRHRFRERDVAALKDAPRSGAPRRISPPGQSPDPVAGLYASGGVQPEPHPLVSPRTGGRRRP